MPVPAITSPSARNVLTPEALAMLQAAARFGSFAAAAREMGLVPSALTYRVRQIEEALDVLLFDRSSRQARLTEAGAELLRQGEQLLRQIDAIANRVKRVATGWEPQLTIAVDTVIERSTLLELVEAFQALNPPTRLRLRDEALSGTLEALISGRADLAIGVVPETASVAGIRMNPVPYKSGPAAMTDLIGGQVMMFTADFAVMVPQVKGGKVRGLAVTSMKRSPVVPELPTVNEALGLKDYELIAYFAAFAPAGTSPEIINRLNAAFNAAATSKDINDRFAGIGFVAEPGTPQALAERTRLETAKWARAIREAKIEAQ